MKKILVILIMILVLIQLNIYAQNQVLSLDGYGDVVNVGNNPILSPDYFTFSVWVNNYSNGYDGIFTNHFGGVDFPSHFFYINNDNKVEIRFYTSDSNTFHGLVSESIIPLNEWVHITATYNGSQLTIFINSTFDNSITASGIPWNSSRDFFIGTGDTNIPSIADFDGQLDEFRIWNYARTQQEIQTDMYSTLTGNETGLVGYWNFDTGVAEDLTVNLNNGVLQGDTEIIYEEIPGFFKANYTSLEVAYIGESIQFIDTSSGSPTTWEWDFENDGIYDSTYYSYQDTIYWTYENEGIYSVKLKISNELLLIL